MFVKNAMGLVLAGTIALAVSAVLIHKGVAMPQEPAQKTLKKVPIVQSKPESGQQMYKDYCAACHGPAGKGDGPAVEFLKTSPSDLTTMATRNHGKFPQEHFTAVLRFGTSEHPHGTSDMPIWGPLFRSQNKNVAELRIANLSSFVKSMQQK
jgi:mono/diheme cytochrome c family protein